MLISMLRVTHFFASQNKMSRWIATTLSSMHKEHFVGIFSSKFFWLSLLILVFVKKQNKKQQLKPDGHLTGALPITIKAMLHSSKRTRAEDAYIVSKLKHVCNNILALHYSKGANKILQPIYCSYIPSFLSDTFHGCQNQTKIIIY